MVTQTVFIMSFPFSTVKNRARLEFPKIRLNSTQISAFRKKLKIFGKPVDKREMICYYNQAVARAIANPGSIAQLVEHMPYKHGVTGSSPVVPTTKSPFIRNYVAR